MSKRIWAGVVAGVLAAAVLLSVGLAAFRAGERHEVVTSTATDGQVVRVIDGAGWGHGPGPFFFLFPLLGILLVVWLVRGARGWGGWRGGYGYGGPPPWAHGGRDDAFQEWHRRAHEQETAGDPGPGGS